METFFENNKTNQTINTIKLMQPQSSMNKCRIGSQSSSHSASLPSFNSSVNHEFIYEYEDYHYQQDMNYGRDRLLPEPNLALISFILLVGMVENKVHI